MHPAIVEVELSEAQLVERLFRRALASAADVRARLGLPPVAAPHV